MKKLLALLGLLLCSSAYADVVFDWTGDCAPGTCVRAWGEIRLSSDYVLGTWLVQPHAGGYDHSPHLRGYALHFDYGLVGFSHDPFHYSESFHYDRATDVYYPDGITTPIVDGWI